MAYRFATTPANSYLGSLTVPNWHSTDFFTLSVRCRILESSSAYQNLVMLAHSSGNAYFLRLYNYNGQYWPQFVSMSNATNYPVTCTSSFSTTDTDWHHILAISNRNDETLYVNLDGGSLTSAGSIKFPEDSPSTMQFGLVYPNGMNGDLAEIALWNQPVGLLSAGQRSAHAQGFSPYILAPQYLIGYWPLIRELTDSVGGNHLTAYNSPAVSEHPPVIG